MGARVEPAQDQKAAANAVRQMFSSIAPRYDLLNHVLSLSVDRYWWWRTARRFRHILRHGDAAVLDLCCGTGDMTFALYRQAGTVRSLHCGRRFRPPDALPRRAEECRSPVAVGRGRCSANAVC